jgi:hypothetical protein
MTMPPCMPDNPHKVATTRKNLILPVTEYQRAKLDEDLSWSARMPGVVPPHRVSSLGFQLSGSLKLDVLRSALHRVKSRHEAFRAKFHQSGGTWSQLIDSNCEPDLRIVESASPGALLREQQELPFDPGNGSLMRVILSPNGPSDYTLIFSFDRLVYDAWWSERIFLADFSKLYNAIVLGKEPELPELRSTYSSYLLWERDEATGMSFEHDERFWARQLAGMGPTPPLSLPGIAATLPLFKTAGGEITLNLTAQCSAAIRDLARRTRSSLLMMTIALVNTFIYRTTGQCDIGVLSPINYRPLPDMEDIIGPLANMVVLRSDISGNPTFREVLCSARSTVLAALDHQDMPFYRLVRDHDRALIERSWTTPCLALTAFESNQTRLELCDLTVQRIHGGPKKTENFSLWLIGKGDHLILRLGYPTDCISRPIAQDFVEGIAALAQEVVLAPDRGITDFARESFGA